MEIVCLLSVWNESGVSDQRLGAGISTSVVSYDVCCVWRRLYEAWPDSCVQHGTSLVPWTCRDVPGMPWQCFVMLEMQSLTSW